jgi:hypothetical protein
MKKTIIPIITSSKASTEIGTSIQRILYSPHLAPPEGNFNYGKEVTGFVLSKIYDFGDTSWQLRSICINQKWFLYPFFLHPGINLYIF